jgi:hypothetical protein
MEAVPPTLIAEVIPPLASGGLGAVRGAEELGRMEGGFIGSEARICAALC